MKRLLVAEWVHSKPQAARKAIDSALALLGVVPRNVDAAAAIAEDFSSGRRAVYLSSRELIALPETTSMPEATQALVHEIVHAIQDHRHDLGRRLTYVAGGSDRIAAYSALAEGEALHVERDLDVRPGDGDLDVPDARDDEADDPLVHHAAGGLETLPALLRRSLQAPYVDGFRFVSYVRRLGGLSLVDWVWSCDSLGTGDILHPERWLSASGSYACPPPARETFTAEVPPWATECLTSHADTLGESALRLILAESLPFSEATWRAAEYSADRITLFQVGEWSTVLWQIRSRTEKGIAHICEGLASTLAGAAASRPIRERSCWDRKETSVALSCSGRDIRVLAREPWGGRLSATHPSSCPEMLEWLGAIGAAAR
jgi:hypothetical protein